MIVESTDGWEDYELLDSGDCRKLERFGQYLLDRPDPQALWKKHLESSFWTKADAIFEKVTSDSGKWIKKGKIPDQWPMTCDGLSFSAALTPFKHTGVFPEQINHWHWLSQKVRDAQRPVRVLNLFGYTGIATLFAAEAGAEVTHVDSSRKSLTWARHNQEESNLGDKKIRWILDDVSKFVQREIRRGSTYDAVVMDPPVYGHGPAGERWNFDTDFPKLVEACGAILSPDPLFILVSAYATTNSAITLGNVLSGITSSFGGSSQVGELTLKEKDSPRLLPAGIFARWSPS